jgi:FAD:protein FMN transferase
MQQQLRRVRERVRHLGAGTLMNEINAARGPSRRGFLALGTGVFAVSALGLSVRKRQLVRRSVPVMGTIADIAVVTRDERSAHQALNAAVTELQQVERLMTRFHSGSDIGRANLGAYDDAVVISAATAAVVREGLRWACADGSRFDPCIGRVTELWDVTRRDAPPQQASVRRLAGRHLYRGLELGTSSAGDVLRFHDADIAVDLGGIAKGYGVDRAVAALRAWGVTDALVNVGGDLYALGVSAEGDPWKIGIRSPVDPSGIAGTLRLSDRAVATSGDYEQYFDHSGQRYHHLLDPATAAPRVAAAHSLSIAAATCMTADAAATAVYGLSTAAARQVLARVAADAAIVNLV